MTTSDSVPRPDGLGRRRRCGDDPMELLPRSQRRGPQGAVGRHRRALLATSRPRRPAHGRCPRVGMGAPSGARAGAAVHPPGARLHVAIPAAARHPSPRGLGRGDLQRWGLGAAGQVVRGTTPPVPRPRALGVVRRVLQGARRAVQRAVQSPTAPATVVLLSGDVHCSYTAGATSCARRRILGRRSISSRCRPSGTTSNGPPSWPTGCSDGGACPAIRRLSASAGVAEPDITWELDEGPWFDNGVMSIEFHGAEARAIIEHAHVRDGDRQELERTLELELSPTG